MPSNCGAGEDSWNSLVLQGDQTSQTKGKPVLNIHWKDWCWRWSILVTWCEQPTHFKSPWCLERLRVGGGEGIREWDGWMASPMQWTWTWANWEMVNDRKAWHAVVHGVAKSWTWLGDWTTTKQDTWLTHDNMVTIRLSLLFQAQDGAHAVCLLTKGIHEVKTFDRFVISVVISSYMYNAKESFLFFLIHVNVWQKPLQYCKVISLQLIKINGKKIQVLFVLFLLFKEF